MQVAREVAQQTHRGELGSTDREPADAEREVHQGGVGVSIDDQGLCEKDPA